MIIRFFNTEQECYEHEQQIKKSETERIKKEKLESERKILMNQICQKRKELSELTQIYYKKFGVTMGEYLPFSEFLKILYE